MYWQSWKYVKEEKAPDMIHVLQFPYNGEPPRVRSFEARPTMKDKRFTLI